ncbi:MAG: NifU family protein [Calditrichaeota bacterium]|nr:NifU family protein [Calditrichota bacterium]
MAEFRLENTPNPNTIKINVDQMIYAGTIEYLKNRKTNSEFAQEIFKIDGVEGVFILKDFLTVTKAEDASFNDITPKVLDMVNLFIEKQKSFGEIKNVVSDEKELGEVEQKIVDILNKYVRPAVAQDGGDITYNDFRDGTVYLQMKGSCSGCPSSTMTLKNGIERMLQNYVPEVQSVEAV